ncbi:hypothetical protein CPB85DRAFT_1453490 [Mucidula mucida]|nr:hypothetical protein CPB85DRAFT_1453490 [Mucidula mucida]
MPSTNSTTPSYPPTSPARTTPAAQPAPTPTMAVSEAPAKKEAEAMRLRGGCIPCPSNPTDDTVSILAPLNSSNAATVSNTGGNLVAQGSICEIGNKCERFLGQRGACAPVHIMKHADEATVYDNGNRMNDRVLRPCKHAKLGSALSIRDAAPLNLGLRTDKQVMIG